MRKIIILTHFFLFLIFKSVYAEKVEKIIVSGNERISSETIIIFGEININEDLNKNKLNLILKNLYKTNFFEDVKINISNNTLNIFVAENPIVQSVKIEGIKAKKLQDPILESLQLKKILHLLNLQQRKIEIYF